MRDFGGVTYLLILHGSDAHLVACVVHFLPQIANMRCLQALHICILSCCQSLILKEGCDNSALHDLASNTRRQRPIGLCSSDLSKKILVPSI